MRRPIVQLRILTSAGVLLLLASCSQTFIPADQKVTVTLKDGASYSGMITNDYGSTITLKDPEGESETWPISNVSTIRYGSESPPPALAKSPLVPLPQMPAPDQPAYADDSYTASQRSATSSARPWSPPR